MRTRYYFLFRPALISMLARKEKLLIQYGNFYGRYDKYTLGSLLDSVISNTDSELGCLVTYKVFT